MDTTTRITKIAIVSDSLFSLHRSKQSDPTDTCRIIGISGNTITIESITKDSTMLVVFQNHLPGWHCKVNQREQRIETVNFTTMGIKIPAGKTVTKLTYAPKGLYAHIFVNMISLFTFTLVLFFCMRKNI